jgi:transposase
VKEWDMTHKIKALYDNGKGSSVRSIVKELGISRNTVRKYLRMDEAAITKMQEERSRHKILDDYRDYIIHLLQTYPRLSAVKVLRKLEDKVGTLEVSGRSVRRYIRTLRENVAFKHRRYYEPVLDMIPGVQCQVDPGEISGIMIGGKERTVYFLVFVLSYSRLMYVAVSPRPIDTDTFIRIHDRAFRYFGGCPEECVYDQTRLVVIKETFRELELNQRFHQYATGAGFQIRACEGYDPESKGKVEAGVKYVKNNALYGESFSDWSELEEYLATWLEKTANARIHGTTGKVPRAGLR